MPSKYPEKSIAFARRLLAECLPVPATLLRHYRDWGLNEQELIVLLRIIRPLLDAGRVSRAEIAAEFGVAEQDAPLLMQPFVDNLMLSAEGEYYNGDGLLREMFQLWLDQQSQQESAAPRRRSAAFAEDKQQIRTLSRLYRRFEADLGRNLGQSENERLRSWLNDEHHSPELIEEALKRAKLHDKANFAYIDSILSDWRIKGYHTLAEVQKLDGKASGATATGKKSKKGEFDFLFEEKLQP